MLYTALCACCFGLGFQTASIILIVAAVKEEDKKKRKR